MEHKGDEWIHSKLAPYTENPYSMDRQEKGRRTRP